jgi:hypothetical protein
MNRNHVALVALGVLVNTLYPATEAPRGDAGCAKPRVHEPLQHPPTLFARDFAYNPA